MDIPIKYTRQQVEEICQWFKEHKDLLPASYDFDVCTHVDNLADTVDSLCKVALQQYANPTFSAQISMLFDLKERLEEKAKQ